ncbi:GNAT family N-acetyltransferase [Deinococcus aquatilis]|uniref:GNAT family N-acetyltransferase n=1 Tax=Deinococcus aquatilis TaxID=519440 RepID=UPI0003A0968A|nr:GNAT family N-acetyltransferase [Deinococcus aquatilis]
MRLQSLGYRTDLIFAHFGGWVTDLGEALAVANPRSPAHDFGNLLIFRKPPQPKDLPRWEALFAEHIGHPPATPHRLFAWDVPARRNADLEELLKAGYRPEQNVVMTAARLHAPPHLNTRAEYRPLADTAEEWAQALENQVVSREDGHDEERYRRYKESQFHGLRELCRAGRGFWYGAFVDGQLVADHGVFPDSKGLLRYQRVGTDPAYRRQGLCGTLTFFPRTLPCRAVGDRGR